jgi:hypothetical protein
MGCNKTGEKWRCFKCVFPILYNRHVGAELIQNINNTISIIIIIIFIIINIVVIITQ